MSSTTTNPSDAGTVTHAGKELRTRNRVKPGELTLSAMSIAGWLGIFSIALIVLAIAGQIARWEFASTSGLITVFDLDAEKNVPALFSGFIITIAAACAWLIGCQELNDKLFIKWRVLAVGILVMAFDEVFSIHERSMDSIRNYLGNIDLGYFTFAWVIPALILLPLLAMYFIPLLRALPKATAVGFILAAAVYLGGAVGMEMIGGKYLSDNGSNLAQSLIAILEESCEMLGICLFIYFALRHMTRHANTLAVKFAQ